MSILDFLIVAGLLFANAFFVAAEFALVKVRTTQIDQLVAQGRWAAKVTSRLLDHLDAYLSASQLGITLASLGLGWAIHRSIEPFVERGLNAVGLTGGLVVSGTAILIVPTLSFLLVTFLHICLGELVPKSLAIRSSKAVALWTAPPLMAFYYIFYPIIWVLNKASDLVLQIFGMGPADHAALVHTEEELRHILGESAAGGHLSRNERIMIENVLNLEEKTARRVMVPRPDIVYLSLSKPTEENLRVARQAGHTRYPICEDDLATVIGMVHVKDLFRAGGASSSRPDLRQLTREIPFLSETMHLDDLLVAFQRNRIHVAMLLDEYGGISGMVTLENVLEQLVGPIQDEFDRESPLISTIGEGIFEVDAACPVDVMTEYCRLSSLDTEAETVGGVILEYLGRFPAVGESIELDGHRFTVLMTDPRRIRRIRVEPVEIDPASTV